MQLGRGLQHRGEGAQHSQQALLGPPKQQVQSINFNDYRSIGIFWRDSIAFGHLMTSGKLLKILAFYFYGNHNRDLVARGGFRLNKVIPVPGEINLLEALGAMGMKRLGTSAEICIQNVNRRPYCHLRI